MFTSCWLIWGSLKLWLKNFTQSVNPLPELPIRSWECCVIFLKRNTDFEFILNYKSLTSLLLMSFIILYYNVYFKSRNRRLVIQVLSGKCFPSPSHVPSQIYVQEPFYSYHYFIFAENEMMVQYMQIYV